MYSLYIANKMSGMPWLNFPWFFEAERRGILNGWDVLNPAAFDIARGFNAYDLPWDSDWDNVEADMSWDELLTIDEGIIEEQADAIYMGKDWKFSRGAIREWNAARKKGIPVLYEGDAFLSPEEVFDVREG